MFSAKVCISTLIVALGASALPTKQNIADPQSIEKRGTWNDGYGDIPDTHFSVIIWGGGQHTAVQLAGSGWKDSDTWLKCWPSYELHGSPQNDPYWNTASRPQLPWSVSISSGNTCASDGFDNIYIKYGAEYLDVPSDTRCGFVQNDVILVSKHKRCLIPINP